MTLSVGGCGSINAWLGPKIADTVPTWAGGLPEDAPPRPGTQAYEDWKRDNERRRLEQNTEQAEAPAPTQANAPAPQNDPRTATRR